MKNLLKTHKNKITTLLFIAVAINILVMRVFDAPLKNEICPNGIVSYELAKDLDKTVAILNSWDGNAKINASLSMGFDYLFLLVYSSIIAMLIFNINNRLWEDTTFYKVGSFLIVLIFVAALFDAIENFALIKLLLGDLKQHWSSTAYYFAVGKFAIILICFLYLLLNWILLLFKVQKTPRYNNTQTRPNPKKMTPTRN